MSTGRVYLVGAGPGDPDLITVKAQRCLEAADVVVYDALVDVALLELCRPEVKRIYVGKRQSRHTLPQDEINALLVEEGLSGKTVVRLKGGDPFVFGRGGEEALALAAAGVRFEIVPGVTAGVAVPAAANVPVTHRGISSAVTFVTGHGCERNASPIRWAELARVPGTLVVFMGLGSIGDIASGLVAGGRAASTPAAVIADGTTKRQRVIVGTLADIAERVAAAALAAPALLVIGEVVSVRAELDRLAATALPPPSSNDGVRSVAIAPDPDHDRARGWLAVAFGSLFVAGLLAVLLVVARTPVLSWIARDPGFFKRCLVAHVDLALVVWFYAFVAALFALVPSRVRANVLGRQGAYVAGTGAVALVFAAFARDATPVLANYVPVVDHPLHVAGLAAIGVGLALSFLDPRLLPRNEGPAAALVLPPAAIVAVRAAGLAVIVALLTFAASAMVLTPGLAAEARWERVMWGGGHVLQFASVAAMLAAWTMLVARATGSSPVSRPLATLLLATLITPVLAAPIFAVTENHHGFTQLMQFGIAPAMLAYLAFCARALVVRRAKLSDPAALGFWASATLSVLGVVLGASIRGPNTVIPAHYHASIGAVTVSFMAITPQLLEALGLSPLEGRLAKVARIQPALLGFGQAVFAIGFAVAGQAGMQRKAYGGEQHVRTLSEWFGLTVMGVGGAVAVAGGVLFLIIVGAMWRRRAMALTRGGETWRALLARTRSNA